jgi:hypothetical protein
MQPMGGTMCPQIGQNCDYMGTQCNCTLNGNWRCNPCPATQPSGACMNMGGGAAKCDYGATQCTCLGGGNAMWSCAMCPAQAPMDGSSCQGSGGLLCDYGAAGACACFGNQWNCQTPCPATQPNPGDMCANDGQQCAYGNTTCICNNGQFFCN